MKKYIYIQSVSNRVVNTSMEIGNHAATAHAEIIANRLQVPVFVREIRVVNQDAGGNEMPVSHTYLE